MCIRDRLVLYEKAIDKKYSMLDKTEDEVQTLRADLLNFEEKLSEERSKLLAIKSEIKTLEEFLSEQEIFEEMQEFCLDSFEHGDYKLNDTFRITSKSYQKKMNALWQSRSNKRLRQTGGTALNPSWKIHNPIYRSPYTATGSIYLVNHDDVVTLHMVYKKYITKTHKVVTLDEL